MPEKPAKPPRPSLRVRTAARKLLGKMIAACAHAPEGSIKNEQIRGLYIEAFIRLETALLADANKREAALRATVERLAAALKHDVPEGCWATGPLTGDPIEDLVVCPGCRALKFIPATPPREPKEAEL